MNAAYHIKGLEIHTYDNPGWGVKYNFKTDDYKSEYWSAFRKMVLIKFHKENDFSDSNQDWCSAMGDSIKFTGSGGPLYLGVLLKVFGQWYSKFLIDPGDLPVTLNLKNPKDMNNLEWLQWYYFDLCNGDWEHTYGIRIEAVEEGWTLNIDITDTIFQDFEYNGIKKENYHCWVENRVFKGRGSKNTLDLMIGEFRQWMQQINTILGYEELPLGEKNIDPWSCE